MIDVAKEVRAAETRIRPYVRETPVEAGKLLGRLGLAPETIRAVQRAIAAHRASAGVERRSPEAECLASADALAHLENVPSLLHLAYVRRRRGIDDGAAWVRAKLERSWGKLSPQVRDEARDTYHAALAVLGAGAPPAGTEGEP